MKGVRTIEAFILAGGKSSRMGEDKGNIIFSGRPLISYVLKELRNAGFRANIIANNSGYHNLGVTVIADELKGLGPIGGLYTALQNSEADYVLIVPCDMPFINSKAVTCLLSALKEEEILYAESEGIACPLFALYHKSLINKVMDQIRDQDYKLKHLIFSSKSKKVDFSHILKEQPYLFSNLNTREDLSVLKKGGDLLCRQIQ